MRIKKEKLLLIIIFFLAAIIRFWGVGFGPYHPDEPLVINQSLAFGTGNFIPSVYYYPPLLHYVLFIIYGLFYVLGWIFGPFRNFDNFLTLTLINPMPFYIIGRVIVALTGALTVIPVYIIAKRLHSEKAASLSSIFISCMYLHVCNSHYCTVDVPMTFMVILTYVFIMKIIDTNNIKDYLWAGLLAGLAISTKYNAGILIFCIGAASFSNLFFKKNNQGSQDIIKKLLLSYTLALISFLIFCSYVIIDFPGFLRALNVLYKIGAAFNIDTSYRFKVDLFYGMGPLLELFGMAGFIYIAFKKRKTGIIFSLFPILYLLGIRKIGQYFPRYSLPLLPFFAVSAGIFLDVIISKLKIHSLYKRILLYLIVFLIICYPCAKSIYADYLLSKPDIRDLAKKWVHENIPYGAALAIDNSQHAPFFYPTKEQLKEKLNMIQDIKDFDLKRKRLKLLLSLNNYPSNTYRVFYFGTSPAEFIMHTPVIHYDKESIFLNGIDYIITNDISEQYNMQFYEQIKKHLTLVKNFTPFKKPGQAYSKYAYSYLPLDNTLFNLRNCGVGVKIYKVKR